MTVAEALVVSGIIASLVVVGWVLLRAVARR